jgi:hypothetical protein
MAQFLVSAFGPVVMSYLMAIEQNGNALAPPFVTFLFVAASMAALIPLTYALERHGKLRNGD